MLKQIGKGDWQQIKELSRLYKEQFSCKEQFIQKAIRTNMTPSQRAEVEIALALLTGTLKETDALIHYLMFGGEMNSREEAMNLEWQIENRNKLKEIKDKQLYTAREKKTQDTLTKLRSAIRTANWKIWNQNKALLAAGIVLEVSKQDDGTGNDIIIHQKQ